MPLQYTVPSPTSLAALAVQPYGGMLLPEAPASDSAIAGGFEPTMPLLPTTLDALLHSLLPEVGAVSSQLLAVLIDTMSATAPAVPVPSANLPPPLPPVTGTRPPVPPLPPVTGAPPQLPPVFLPPPQRTATPS
jgi:hypothetical protein